MHFWSCNGCTRQSTKHLWRFILNLGRYDLFPPEFSVEKTNSFSYTNIGYSDQTEPPIPHESEQDKLNSFLSVFFDETSDK